jgi:hypothetical protein
MLTVLVLSLERCDPFVLLSSKESHGGESLFCYAFYKRIYESLTNRSCWLPADHKKASLTIDSHASLNRFANTIQPFYEKTIHEEFQPRWSNPASYTRSLEQPWRYVFVS